MGVGPWPVIDDNTEINKWNVLLRKEKPKKTYKEIRGGKKETVTSIRRIATIFS